MAVDIDLILLLNVIGRRLSSLFLAFSLYRFLKQFLLNCLLFPQKWHLLYSFQSFFYEDSRPKTFQKHCSDLVSHGLTRVASASSIPSKLIFCCSVSSVAWIIPVHTASSEQRRRGIVHFFSASVQDSRRFQLILQLLYSIAILQHVFQMINLCAFVFLVSHMYLFLLWM